MVKVSPLAQNIPASPIRKLVPYAESAARRGVKVYHLNIGQPDIKTPRAAMEAIRAIDDTVIEYTHSAGIESYRRALADFYTARGSKVDYSNIMVTTGGSEAIFFGLSVACGCSGEVIVPEPYYANYNGFAMEAGVKIVPVSSVIADGFALPSIEQFEQAITPATRAIFICNPNNPTGYLYSRSEIEALRDLVVKHNLFLLADEVYSDFCYDGHQHYSVLQLEGVDNNVIVFDSVSKRYSMCGVRVGALLSRNKDVIDAALRMGQARLCAPYLGQIAAQAATCLTPKSYFEAVKEEYVARRDFMIDALNRMPGVTAPCPRGAFYATVGLPVDNSERFAQWLLEDFQWHGATVMVAPAGGFYHDANTCPQNEVRLAYVINIEDLSVAMEILAHALEVYNQK
ncbi:MAG: pyridoxal phosphate-dependent aminotransferase [Mucinivorans sp.]